MKNRFYLACLRDNVGENVAFHSANGNGYPTNVSEAEIYTLEQAQNAWENGRGFDQPISADHVDALTVWKVDCQYIPIENTVVEGCQRYVGYKKGSWNGNDVFWLTDDSISLDFTQAKIFAPDQIPTDDRYVFIPFDLADKVKRNTFSVTKINKRIMMQGAGLKTPKRLLRNKRRKNNPKIRWNCPSCGKINWQHNPHDFEGCADIECEAY